MQGQHAVQTKASGFADDSLNNLANTNSTNNKNASAIANAQAELKNLVQENRHHKEELKYIKEQFLFHNKADKMQGL